MGKIAIHGEQQVKTMCIGPPDAFFVRAADTLFTTTMDGVNVLIFGGQTIHDIAGSVRRIIIQKQNVGWQIEAANAGEQGLHILRLVIGGNKDEQSPASHQNLSPPFWLDQRREALPDHTERT